MSPLIFYTAIIWLGFLLYIVAIWDLKRTREKNKKVEL